MKQSNRPRKLTKKTTMVHARAKEGELVKSVISLLQAHGFQVFRRNTGATMASYTLKSGETKNRFVRFGVGGMADIWGWQVMSGRHIEVEVKRPGIKPTALQEQWLQQARQAGCLAFWCDSMDMALMGLKEANRLWLQMVPKETEEFKLWAKGVIPSHTGSIPQKDRGRLPDDF